MRNGIIISVQLIMVFLSHSTKGISFSSQSLNIRVLRNSDDRNFSSVKSQQIYLFQTGIFYSQSALKRIRPIFQIFWRYLNIYQESILKNKCENEDNLNLFLNELNFIQNGIIIRMLFIKVFFQKSYSPEGISFSSRSMNIRPLAKVLILTTGIFFFVGLTE